MKLRTGIVRWFDNRSGEGLIRDSNDRSIYVHWSAIDVVRDRSLQIPDKLVWGVLFRGQVVSIRVFEDTTFTQIEYVGPKL